MDDGSCGTCSAGQGEGKAGDPHLGCDDLNPVCDDVTDPASPTCSCGNQVCDPDNGNGYPHANICAGADGTTTSHAECKCGGSGETTADGNAICAGPDHCLDENGDYVIGDEGSECKTPT